MPIWINVTPADHHSAPGAFSRVFTLDCGHTCALKGSQGLRKRMRCTQCKAVSP